MMTLAEQLRAEGRAEGFEKGEKRGEKQGKLAIAAELIAEGLDLPFIAKVTKLPMSQLQDLAESMVE